MLMKPRRWLAYNIDVNDLLPQYSQIIDRFEPSDIPLEGAFGSNTEPGSKVPGLLLAVGPGVEPERLLEIVVLLSGLGQLFLAVHDSAVHSKVIDIGALNLDKRPIVAITKNLVAVLSESNATSHSMIRAIDAAPKVAVVR